MKFGLQDIRHCLEGHMPSMVVTADTDTMPNVTYISQAFFVDERHVALSFQFFSKTRQNILNNPRACVLVNDPFSRGSYRLHARFLRTESEGPTFERMSAMLAGIASHTGMQDVFRLKGADIYAVDYVEPVPGIEPLPPPRKPHVLGALRQHCKEIASARSLEDAFDATLRGAKAVLSTAHAMILMLDPGGSRLYTVASMGYDHSGVGSEVWLGDGVIGVAARERVAVRIGHVTVLERYSQAVRDSLVAEGEVGGLSAHIPYPGLKEPHSQLAVPILSDSRLMGVVFFESPIDLLFDYEAEDAAAILAESLASVLRRFDDDADDARAGEPVAPPVQQVQPEGPLLKVRHFSVNDSVFLNNTYLIKGVAGAILFRLLRDYIDHGRIDFSNRELRLDSGLGLPDVYDNLEARLVLLRRRLEEQASGLRVVKTGRGRFRLLLERPVELVSA